MALKFCLVFFKYVSLVI